MPWVSGSGWLGPAATGGSRQVAVSRLQATIALAPADWRLRCASTAWLKSLQGFDGRRPTAVCCQRSMVKTIGELM